MWQHFYIKIGILSYWMILVHIHTCSHISLLIAAGPGHLFAHISGFLGRQHISPSLKVVQLGHNIHVHGYMYDAATWKLRIRHDFGLHWHSFSFFASKFGPDLSNWVPHQEVTTWWSLLHMSGGCHHLEQHNEPLCIVNSDFLRILWWLYSSIWFS